MKTSNLRFFHYLRHLRTKLRDVGKPHGHAFDELPLRAELLSAEQMEHYGKRLASQHQLTLAHSQNQLLARLAANETILVDVSKRLTAAVKANQQITPASEWLLDNFYLVQEQIRTAKRHLPKGYSKELPRLLNGPSAGLPRVYDIAQAIISHGDGRVDPESLSRFVAAYQTVSELKLGELWAIAIMLRLALIENLRRVAVRIAAGRVDRDLATVWAERMTVVAEKDPKSLVLVVADMARSEPPMSTPFVSEFTRRMQGQSLALALPLTWIEQVLAESGLTIEQMVQSGNQQQAADQVSISNSIGSLRALGGMDWRDFVEQMSVVEHTLRQDPSATYAAMDFATRDRYRHTIERLAKKSLLSERAVAQTALQLAQSAHSAQANHATSARQTHIGFYLIDQGLAELEAHAQVRQPWNDHLCIVGSRHPLSFYLGAVALLTILFSVGLMDLVHPASLALQVLIAFLVLIATSQLALSLVNWGITLLVRPDPLPRMDFSMGIPDGCKSLVVVPTMLSNVQTVEDLVEALEVRFLANRDPNLYFALLTDFTDAPSEVMPQDAALLQLAENCIHALNEKYANAQPDVFYLLHRPRRCNEQARIWMGYERKRGKLADLNALLRGRGDGSFSHIVGDIRYLQNIQYVITLDTDTQLPRDVARQTISTLAHPLNRAVFDAQRQRVCTGYGILQPRVSVSLDGSNRSRYARLNGFDPGIDPYTRVISDVYQDLFGEGSFIGKGIYEVDTFELALGDRFPENRILSHDLLEGCYARAGLLSDVYLYEDYPARYSADMSRRHRWIRGDWQLLGWLLYRVDVPGMPRQKNPLSWLSQWKLFDNLRRSVAPIALTGLLLLGWTLLDNALIWTAAVLGVLLVPPLLHSIVEVLQKPSEVLLRQHLVATRRAVLHRLVQAGFSLATLPYEAYVNADAILRTLWRMLFNPGRLLEWNPSGEAARTLRNDFASTVKTMWIAPAIAIAALVYLVVAQPVVLSLAAPILALWLVSPVLAWWLSQDLTPREVRLSLTQTVFLHKLARRTWAFFETFVGAEDHWLPPDNFQAYRGAAVAHRTSPTNIGLSLLANLAAYDFGYIAAGTLIERTANTLATLHDLERHRGHFYNWYDTLTLAPLHPKYVSTVDSGNLAGHLLTLRAGLLALTDAPMVSARTYDGLRDTLDVVMETVRGAEPAALRELAAGIDAACLAPPTSLAQVWLTLTRASEAATRYANSFDSSVETEPSWWAHMLARQCRSLLEELAFLAPWLTQPSAQGVAEQNSLPTLRELAQLESSGGEQLARAQQRASARLAQIDTLARQINDFAFMEYGFLYDKASRLLAIGYNVDELRRDTSYYDLLASEARLINFVAIAQGHVPQESWFALGRLLTSVGGEPVLISWSGSMFEYLMPLLVMPTFENTLLDQTYQAAVARQIEYGRQRNVPWGMSESGYNLVDLNLNYQYRAFGVPGLGLKRGLAEDLVIAPYASALALLVAPEAACANLQRLASDGLAGRFGLHEAIDYTPARQRRGETSTVVKSYMAHHQGMSLLAFAYLLLDRPMQKRFVSDPLFQSTLLLLQERIPRTPVLFPHNAQLSEIRPTTSGLETPIRVISKLDTPMPEVQLLSNGRYHVMVTHTGGGVSRWKDLAVTRWREDSTCDQWGAFCYLRDMQSGAAWSNAYQPTQQLPPHYEAIFSEGRAEFRRRDYDYDAHTEIVVSPEDDIELRRLHLTNRARVRRTISITSYAEVVLAAPAADALHPAFSNLFVQTEIVPQRQAILCTRRPRSKREQVPWLLHLMAVHGANVDAISYETDRMQFIGRGRSTRDPQALSDPAALSGGQGSVLDPIVAIRVLITLDPEQTVCIDMVTGMGESREAMLSLAEKYQDRRLADRVFELAWTHAQVVLRQINASEADAQLYCRLANSVVYANPTLRADANILLQNRRGQSGLWGYAISGDLPIVLLQVGDAANIELVRQLVQAHAYWRLKGLAVDLVIWNEDHAGYRQQLQDQIIGMIAAGIEAHVIDRPGGIFVRSAEQISSEDRILFQSVARAIISDSRGTLAEQINSRQVKAVRVPRLQPTRVYRAVPAPDPAPRGDLILHNGLGGFTPDGREYVMNTRADHATPAPWVNVLANAHFGTVISEAGQAYTWSENAHEYRLTPWHNDPVSDASGEAMYIRDEETGHYWSPTPLPRRGANTYVTRHGFGYSVFEYSEAGISTELWVYVDLDAAVKFSVLKVRNHSGRPRRLSATGYVEWVLGDLRPKSTMHITTEMNRESGALFAHNPYNTEFANRIAFFDVDEASRSFTCDRSEFIGRNGSLQAPAALSRTRLSGKVGAALDPCAAIQVGFELADGQARDFVFRLGCAGNRMNEAVKFVRRLRGATVAHAALDRVHQYWNHTLGAVQVETPDPALNVLSNGWLVYQTLACRLWARSGYYQSGGAFGFRDQLQDVMALVHAEPQRVREHILLAAAHQFVEGDVQHWWHPPANRGVRTHCSDDYLWLPLAVCRYVQNTGDTGVLEEMIGFIDGRPVSPEDDSYYDLPGQSAEVASLYQHCVRAIYHGLRFGEHGLPLMGGGDWNDGMNLVGMQGKGESVWLGFFLYEVLMRFSELAARVNDVPNAERCKTEAAQLRQRIDANAWDGAWYRRAYFDDGAALGSSSNSECQIDSISQSWSVLSGAGDPTRSRRGMQAVYGRLVQRDDALIQLLDPPFDTSEMDPGYIKGYVPGVRENGGQYTHAAIWTVMAFAAQGDNARAWELLNMINPVNHARNAEDVARYKVEPYVVTADVYAVSPHAGRGGWSWYTGSAGWMYRLIIESLLGLTLDVDKLFFKPCLPVDWPSFKLHYRYRETVYHIDVTQIAHDAATRATAEQITLDGNVQADQFIPLQDDRKDHAVEVRIMAPPPYPSTRR